MAQPSDDQSLDLRGLRCSVCGGGLESVDGGGACRKCQKLFPAIDGALILSDAGYYFGEISQDKMRQCLQVARDHGWTSSVCEFLRSESEDCYVYATDPARADWRFIFPLDRKWEVLDLGCGWGTVAAPLARICKRVVAADATKERVQHLGLRRKEQDLWNLTPTCISNALPLPFDDAQFDLVVLNGVLEWVGESISLGSPREAQAAFLREVGRILRPAGCVYVGIENRIGYQYFMGSEDHPGTRFTSLMPRKLASLVTRALKGRPYRAYTYSRSGYRSLFRKAGFEQSDFLICLPDYRQPTVILTAGGYQAHRYFGERIFPALVSGKTWWHRYLPMGFRLLAGLGLTAELAPNFAVVVSRDSRGAKPYAYLEGFLRTHWKEIGLPGDPPAHLFFVQLNSRVDVRPKIVLLAFGEASAAPVAVLRFPRFPEDQEGIRQDLRMRDTVRSLGKGAPGLNIPRAYYSGPMGPYWGSVEEPARGRSLYEGLRLSFSPEAAQRALERAMQLLEAWVKTGPKHEDPREAEATLEFLCGELEKLVGTESDGPSLVERFRSTAREQASGLYGAPVLHNDWHPRNIFVEGESAWVIDWEFALPAGPAGLDGAHLLLQAGREVSGAGRRSLSRVLQDVVDGEGWYGALAQRLLKDHVQALTLRPEGWKTLLLGAVLVRLGLHKDVVENQLELISAVIPLLRQDASAR